MDLVSTLITFFSAIALTVSGWFGGVPEPTLGATPALTVPQGGTGWGNIQAGTLLYGTGTNLQLATTSTSTATLSSAFSYSGTLGKLVGGADGTLSLASHVIFPGSYFAATGTTTNATSTNLGVSLITAIGSSGIDLHSSNGTQILQLGSGGGSNATFSGGVNIDGTTRLATSLTGLAYTTSGTVSAVTNGSGGQVLAMSGGVPTFVATTTAGTGLTYSGGAFNVNTSQNIATLSNLTSNGIVYTSGGAGTLNVGAFSANTIPYVNNAGTAILYTATSSLNLASLTATDSTLTFSGTYNGGTARTVGINLANANTWTALQQFSLASSTVFSAYSAFFGRTATTTIDGAGNIVLPTGASLTDTGTTDGCATWSSGVLTTTGSACAAQTPWTSEINAATFGLANVRTIGIGTSSPYQSALTIDSGSASTTNTYHTGSVNGFLEVNIQNRSSGASASSDLVATADNGTPTTHYIDLGINGSGGGSAPFSTANHAYLYSIDDPLNIGALGTTPVMTFNIGGGTSPIERARFTGAGFGIGTSTPRWALTVSSSTAPQFTLTDASIGNAPFNFRAQNTSLFIGTSSPTTFATTTISMLTLDSSTGSTTAFKLDKSGTATSTFAGGIYLTSGCFSINGTCVGSGAGTPGGSGTEVQYRSGASTFGAITNSAYTSQGVGNGYLGLGTSTPKWTLQLATSTQPQLVLSDTTNLQAPWYFRSISGAFYMGTTSTSTFATTTTPVLSLDTNGAASFSSSITSPVSIIAPIHYGGTAAGSTHIIRSTSGAGVGADATIFQLGNNGANEVGRMTGLGYFGLGTTTPKWLLQIASSTRAQLTLSDGGINNNHYSFRAINNWLYLSTSTPTTFASTTNPVFSITPGGQVSVYAIQPATSTTMTLDWEQTPNQVEYRIGGAATTITLINATTSRMWGSTKRVYVCNPSGTAGALTWAGVEWIGTAPTQTTTADQCDLYSFNVTRATSTSAYKVAGAQSAGLQ